jgi:GNAT superfamily N-acetyltransferase
MPKNSEIPRCPSCGEPTLDGGHVCPIAREARSGRLKDFDPHRLIPSAFFEHEDIFGTPVVLAHASETSIHFLIRDEMSIGQVELEDFLYFQEEELARFPEIILDDEEYLRPLAHGLLYELNASILYEGILETNPALRGTGLGGALLDQIAAEARVLGYSYLCGFQNNAELASFFLKRGYVLLEELTEEGQEKLQPLRDQEDDDSVFYTVNILDPEERVRLIRPDRLDRTVEERIAYKEALFKDLGVNEEDDWGAGG